MSHPIIAEEKNTTVEIPQRYEALVRALITHLDNTSHIRKGYAAVESNELFLRSMQDAPQHIKFITGPVRQIKPILNCVHNMDVSEE